MSDFGVNEQSTIQFFDSTFKYISVCNSGFGNYSILANEIQIPEMYRTTVMCREDLFYYDTLIIHALIYLERYFIKGSQLRLISSDRYNLIYSIDKP